MSERSESNKSRCYAKEIFARMDETLKAGDKVELISGEIQTITKINNLCEAEGKNSFYRWHNYDLEIEHAAMDYKECEIVNVILA